MRTKFAMCLNTAVLVVMGLVTLNASALASDAPEAFQVVDGVAIYFGVVPAQIIHGHPKIHPEATMHGGVPRKKHRDHVVVALFDNDTGQRIENAQVTGSVMEIGLSAKQKKLEPMRIADSVTYGNYFDMPDDNQYHIKVRIRLPGARDVIKAQFTHQHFAR